MPEQFTVPQFIEVEDKILGPLSARQFLILMGGGLVDVILYKLLPFIWFLAAGIPVLILAGIFALTKINGMPFHFFVLNLVQSFRKPKVRVWDKTLPDAEIRTYITKETAPPPPPPVRKAPVSTSRLQELTLVVNTGGVYQPEE
jgi:hypothetical protein